jgi:hypothetical protein
VIDTVAILYEDERGGVRDFPLHTLVVNSVADRLGLQPAQLKHRFEDIPKKGDSKLLKACETEAPRMLHRVIVAIFDADKLHRLLKQPRDTSREELLQQLRARCSDPRLVILLLEDNVESLVSAAATCLGRDVPDQKSNTSRDKVLAAAAWAADTVRTCIREALPSFAHITEELAHQMTVVGLLALADQMGDADGNK